MAAAGGRGGRGGRGRGGRSAGSELIRDTVEELDIENSSYPPVDDRGPPPLYPSFVKDVQFPVRSRSTDEEVKRFDIMRRIGNE
jgi:hypothetical protein